MPLPDSVRVNIEVFGDVNVGPTFVVQANRLFTNIGLSLWLGIVMNAKLKKKPEKIPGLDLDQPIL